MAQKMQTYGEICATKGHPWLPQESQDYVLRSPKVERNKEWVGKNSQEHPASSKVACIKSSIQFTQKLKPLYRNSTICRNSTEIFVQLCTTEGKHPQFTQRRAFPEKMRIAAAISFRAKTIVTSSSRDIHSEREKNYSRTSPYRHLSNTDNGHKLKISALGNKFIQT